MINQVFLTEVIPEALVRFVWYCLISLFDYSLMLRLDENYQKLKREYIQLRSQNTFVISGDISDIDLSKIIDSSDEFYEKKKALVKKIKDMKSGIRYNSFKKMLITYIVVYGILILLMVL